MKNRPRPHIPWSVRYKVITRQVHAAGLDAISDLMTLSAEKAARANLRILFGDKKCHLDHNPPLRVRAYNPRIKNVAARFTPNANDPAHLIYREGHAHHIKTNVRGDGAQFPDRVLIKRERRREKKSHKASTQRIKNRSAWPRKGSRQMQSRGF